MKQLKNSIVYALIAAKSQEKCRYAPGTHHSLRSPAL